MLTSAAIELDSRRSQRKYKILLGFRKPPSFLVVTFHRVGDRLSCTAGKSPVLSPVLVAQVSVHFS